MIQPTIFRPPYADGRRHRADPRAVDADRCANWWSSGVVIVVLFAAFVAILMAWSPSLLDTIVIGAVLGVVAIGATVLGYWYPRRFYQTYAYRLRPEWIEVRKGICFRRVIAVPRARIQHIDVARGPIARSYGIAKVVLHTAGSMYSDVTIEGLAAETAFRIRDKLIEERRSRAK